MIVTRELLSKFAESASDPKFTRTPARDAVPVNSQPAAKPLKPGNS